MNSVLKQRCKGNYNEIKIKNIEDGDKFENEIYEDLKKYLDGSIQKSKSIFSSFDFYSEKYLIECKNRENIEKDQYRQTIIPYKKVFHALHNRYKEKVILFLFKFKDGVFYWILDKENYWTIPIKKFGTNARGVNEQEEYLFVDVSMLSPFCIENIENDIKKLSK